MKKRILVVTAAVLAVGAFATARPAVAYAQADNTAIAVNTKDGGSVFKIAFAIRHVMSDVVDTSNAAVAYSSCTECDTVAIAIEIVLVQDSVSTLAPTNIALSINELCSLCVTVAEAYQFVVMTGGNVHFDAEGNRILAGIRNRLERLKHEQLTVAELQAELDAIKEQIKDVLAHHLVRAGPPRVTNAPSTSTQPAATTTTTPPATTTAPESTTTTPPETTTSTETTGTTTTSP